MISLILLQTLGAIGPQALPPTGCAAFLWNRAEPPQLVAMVAADPGSLRLQLDGTPLTLPRTAAEGLAGRGFGATTRYTGGAVVVTLAMSSVERPDVTDGALVPDATLTVEEAGKDTIVAPLAGLIGCARAK